MTGSSLHSDKRLLSTGKHLIASCANVARRSAFQTHFWVQFTHRWPRITRKKITRARSKPNIFGLETLKFRFKNTF